MAASRRGDGSALPGGRRLGHGPPSSDRARDRRARDGDLPTSSPEVSCTTPTKERSSPRSRSVGSSATPGSSPRGCGRHRVRQRCRGELLLDDQAGARSSTAVHHSGRGEERDLGVDRGLLRPSTPSLNDRQREPSRIRKEPSSRSHVIVRECPGKRDKLTLALSRLRATPGERRTADGAAGLRHHGESPYGEGPHPFDPLRHGEEFEALCGQLFEVSQMLDDGDTSRQES